MGAKNRSAWFVIIIVGLILFTIGLVIMATAFGEEEVYTIKEVQVAEATVIAKDYADGCFIRVSVPELSAPELECQTTEEFYQEINPGQSVGVLVGLVDKSGLQRSWDKRQLRVRYDSSQWEVLSLYRSLAAAQAENQPATSTMTATLKERIRSLDGKFFFLFDVGGKNVLAEVNPEYYQRYTLGNTSPDSFELEFEGIGEHTRFVQILKP